MSLACWISNGFSWMYFHFFNPSPLFFYSGNVNLFEKEWNKKNFVPILQSFITILFIFLKFFFMSDQEVEFWCAFHPNQYVMSMV